MWTPWQVAAMTGFVAGCASALPQLDLAGFLVLTGAALVAAIVCFVTWFGLWISKRPRVSFAAAVGIASASAVIVFLSSLPIETHAELIESPAVLEDQVISVPGAHVIGLAALVLPALIAFVIGRVFGVPPNTSLERTREG